MKKLNKKTIESLVKKIIDQDEKSYGKYEYKDFVIVVKPTSKVFNKNRSRRFYYKRRELGLCVYCGKKVEERNPRTKKPYRYCEEHRIHESNKRKERLGQQQ